MKPRRIAVAFDATLTEQPGIAPAHDAILSTVDAVIASLKSRGYSAFRLPILSAAKAPAVVRRSGADVVFNLVEGLDGDSRAEAEFERAMQVSGVAVTGCPASAMDLCLDKARTKETLARWGLPVPAGRVFAEPGPSDGLRFPLIVKCLREDASLGLDDGSIVRTEAALKARVAWLVDRFQQPAIVEEYLEGREFNVALAGPRPTVLPISEIDFSTLPAGKPKFVSYEAKWVTDSVEYKGTVPICPAEISGPAAARLRRLALRAARLVGCRDSARVDFRTDATGKPFILEINPNPDISPDAGFARSAKAHGWSYDDLAERLALWAWRRRMRVDGGVASRALPG